jgi:hypothetical protein
MKKVFFSLLCVTITSAALHAQDQNKPVNVPPPPPQAAAPVDPDAGKFKFKEETHDYGEVPEGPKAECDFEFKNVGKKPIVISEAHGSCGCTVPQWPSEPILPGKKGKIHVVYNTDHRPGPISKEVTINSNAAQQPMVIHIRGTVKAKPVEAVAAPPAGAPAPAGH